MIPFNCLKEFLHFSPMPLSWSIDFLLNNFTYDSSFLHWHHLKYLYAALVPSSLTSANNLNLGSLSLYISYPIEQLLSLIIFLNVHLLTIIIMSSFLGNRYLSQATWIHNMGVTQNPCDSDVDFKILCFPSKHLG